VLAIIAALGSTPAFAEVPEEVWAVLKGAQITVEMQDGTTHRGRLIVTGEDTVNLVMKDGQIVSLPKKKVNGVIKHLPQNELREGVLNLWGKVKPTRQEPDSDASEEEDPDTWEKLGNLDDLESSGIAPGEMTGAGYLCPETAVIRAISGTSSFRVHDVVDVRTNLARWFSGPNGGVKINLMETGDSAFALEPEFWQSWDFRSHSIGTHLRYTTILPKAWVHLSMGMFNERLYANLDWDGNDVTWGNLTRMFQLASLEGRYDADDSGVSLYGVRIPISVDVDWIVGDKSMLRTGLHSTIADLFQNTGHTLVARLVYFTTRGDHGRLGFGLSALTGEYIPDFRDDELDDAADDLEEKLNIPELPVSPLPWFELWWAF
jgi:hypothetical protein